MEITEVMALLPHRYPFLMVDRVLSVEPGKRATALKNVTVNEPQFTGHYPGRPLFPGALIIEAMAQTTGVAYLAQNGMGDRVPVLAGVDGVRFRRPVVPGDQLVIEAEIVRAKGGLVKADCRATVGGELAAEAVIMFASLPAGAKEGDN